MHNENEHESGSSIVRTAENSPAREIAYLPLAQKIINMRRLPQREKLNHIISDPEAGKIVNALEPQEVYWMIKDIGENDALALLELCNPEQVLFFLDMECWEKDEFSTVKFMEWLNYIIENGEKKIIDLLPSLDLEFLLLLLTRTISVGGGIGTETDYKDQLTDWDHTFDDCFFINFRDPAQAHLIGRFIDIIFRNNHSLYLALMEGVQAVIPSEAEELSYQFKAARLADLGFPAYEDAVSIYAYVDPESYSPTAEKKLHPIPAERHHDLPMQWHGNSLLERALFGTMKDELLTELNSLINNAIIAEGTPTCDGESPRAVFERVYGYLNIALEFLCGENEQKAAELLEKEHLKRLFQLGRGVILPLRKTAERLYAAGDNYSYAVNKALLGLRTKHPRFYRGLDPDTVDGYREFSKLDDVNKMQLFLNEFVDRQDR